MTRQEALDFLAATGREIVTQDNLMTAHPVWIISSSGRPVAWCLTDKACAEYEAREAHNLHSKSVYVDSQGRNPEWVRLRAALAALATETPCEHVAADLVMWDKCAKRWSVWSFVEAEGTCFWAWPDEAPMTHCPFCGAKLPEVA